MKCHYEQTVRRIGSSKSKYILAIQDQMRLNYTDHEAKTELGSIGRLGKTEQYGIIQHSVLCVSDRNEPFGLMDVCHFDHDEVDTTTHHYKRSLEDKVSHHWVTALKAMRKRLGKVEQRIITVADREGDFYEFLHPLIEEKEEFVIRAKHDRSTIGKTRRQPGEKLWSLLQAASLKGSMVVDIQDVNSREVKAIRLNLKAVKATFPVPPKLVSQTINGCSYQAVTIHAVMAYDGEHEWVVLTNLPIDTLEQVMEIIEIYRSRWHIEDYHKVLKTGYQVDEIYLHRSRNAIINLLLLASISACRLYWLIYIGRSEPNIRADQVFEAFEWKSIYVFFKEKIPEKCPPLSEVILKVARLGGYKPTKEAGPPGIQTMWVAFQQFTNIAQMYRNMSNET